MWQPILNFTLNIFKSMTDIAQFLFTTYSMSDLITSMYKLLGQVVAPNHITDIMNTVKLFFQTNGFGKWLSSIHFTPIELIGVGGLTFIVLIGVIKLVDMFA